MLFTLVADTCTFLIIRFVQIELNGNKHKCVKKVEKKYIFNLTQSSGSSFLHNSELIKGLKTTNGPSSWREKKDIQIYPKRTNPFKRKVEIISQSYIKTVYIDMFIESIYISRNKLFSHPPTIRIGGLN